MEFIHSQKFSHRDLKPENILLTHTFDLKIADFGFSTLLAGIDDSGLLSSVVGTEGYMAPEIYSNSYSGEEVDLFAAAVSLFVLYSGK